MLYGLGFDIGVENGHSILTISGKRHLLHWISLNNAKIIWKEVGFLLIVVVYKSGRICPISIMLAKYRIIINRKVNIV